MSSAAEEGNVTQRPAAAAANNPNPSIESARRFLYDEDEDPIAVVPSIGTYKNTPLPHPKDIRYHESKRLNPLVAAGMATCATCRNMGMKSLLMAVGVTFVLLVVITGIVSMTNQEPSDKNRAKTLSTRIVSSGLSTTEQLQDVTSPQYHALQYVANIDTTTSSDLNNNNGEDDNNAAAVVLQKYALAVFFYGLSDGDDTSHVDPIAGWKRQDDWMSATVGMCDWYGVKCELDEDGPTFDGNADVTAIVLPGNNLMGSLPSELTALTKLLTLDLSQNMLTGSLPHQYGGAWTELRSMVLSDNQIEGLIPSEFGDFASLRTLFLGGNQLGGTIPKQLEHVVTLQTLSLEGNQLQGSIPDFEDNIKMGTYQSIMLHSILYFILNTV
jgi:hypothetical protein